MRVTALGKNAFTPSLALLCEGSGQEICDIESKRAATKVAAAWCWPPHPLRHLGEDMGSIEKSSTRLVQKKAVPKPKAVGDEKGIKDAKSPKALIQIQATSRGFLARKTFAKMQEKRDAAMVVQQNVRVFLKVRSWPWMKLLYKLKPQLKSNVPSGGQGDDYSNDVAALTSLGGGGVGEDLQKRVMSLLLQKRELQHQIQAEQVNVTSVEMRCGGLKRSNVELQGKVEALTERLQDEEERSADLETRTKKLEEDSANTKLYVEDLELLLVKGDKEKVAVENKAKKLLSEVTTLEESILKMTKENKALQENHALTLEDLRAEEDKVVVLKNTTARLEMQVDEVEGALEKEKKVRLDLERVKRKLEVDLKLLEDTMVEMNNGKQQLEEKLRRKDFEVGNLSKSRGEEMTLTSQLQRKIIDLQTRNSELEERSGRLQSELSAAERRGACAAAALDKLAHRLEEAEGEAVVRADSARKRELELQRLRRGLEEATVQQEEAVTAMRAKHGDALVHANEQIEDLHKLKQNLEKEKCELGMQVEDLGNSLEQLNKTKVSLQKANRLLDEQLCELRKKDEAGAKAAGDLAAQRALALAERDALGRQLEEKELQVTQAAKLSQSLTQMIEDLRQQLLDEGKARATLSGMVKAARHDRVLLGELGEEEEAALLGTQRALSQAHAEVAQWRAKYEMDVIQRTDELEDAKKKITVRLQVAEEEKEAANAKCASLEKTRKRLQIDVDDLTMESERVQAANTNLQKKQKAFETVLAEWKQRQQETQGELLAAQKESCALGTEVFKLKNLHEEMIAQVENLKRDKEALQGEVQDLVEQLADRENIVRGLEKSRKQLETEKMEALASLEELETSLEYSEGRVMRTKLEITQAKAEMARRLSEKDEEVVVMVRLHQRNVESLQFSLEAEMKAKAEAVRLSKKIETELIEKQTALAQALRQASEAQEHLKGLQAQIKALQLQLDEEERGSRERAEQCVELERRCGVLQEELQEAAAALEQAERCRRASEQEAQDVAQRVQLLLTQNTSLISQKKKLESDLAEASAALEKSVQQNSIVEERAAKATSDLSMVSDELQASRDVLSHMERVKANMEDAAHDLQARLQEAEEEAMKGGKKQLLKMEARMRELQSDLDEEQRRSAETVKTARKHERRVKELTILAEEDRKTAVRQQDLVEKLQLQVKSYKKQSEEAEAQINTSLAKCRKVQHQLGSAEERADAAESQVQKLRSRCRNGVGLKTDAK
ncbi:unnamed protein product [Lampetra fluviatilis]